MFEYSLLLAVEFSIVKMPVPLLNNTDKMYTFLFRTCPLFGRGIENFHSCEKGNLLFLTFSGNRMCYQLCMVDCIEILTCFFLLKRRRQRFQKRKQQPVPKVQGVVTKRQKRQWVIVSNHNTILHIEYAYVTIGKYWQVCCRRWLFWQPVESKGKLSFLTFSVNRMCYQLCMVDCIEILT